LLASRPAFMVTWCYAKNRTSFHRRDLLPRFEPRQRAAGQDVFHEDDDHQRFIELIQEACARVPMRVLAWAKK
jgi:hypothetical protein